MSNEQKPAAVVGQLDQPVRPIFGSAEEFSTSEDPHCKDGSAACIDCLMFGMCIAVDPPRKCSRPNCTGDMLPGVAMGQTFTGMADFPGCEVVTVSPCGPGAIVQCLKCNACGNSVSA